MKIYFFVDGTKINGLYSRKIKDTMPELDLTESEYDFLYKNISAAHFESGKIVYKNLDAIKEKQALEKEQADILQWFTDNDWKVNKIVLGEWTQQDQRWIDYTTNRQNKRKRLDEIKIILERRN